MTDVIPGSLHQVVAPGVGWQEIGVRQTDCTALAPPRQAEDRQVAMNAAQDRYRLPQMKASDADRDAVVAALSEHFQTGRLTREELDERTGRALTARTLDELDELRPIFQPSARLGRRRWSGRGGWGTRCWRRLLPRLLRWPLPPWCSAWAMAARGGIGGGSSRPVCSSRGGWPGGAVSTGTPGGTDRRAKRDMVTGWLLLAW
jgi:hypothetical protein